jgi:tetratricopeptide (TPR) repeat protein
MKAEKRKELAKNDLAAGIEKLVAGVTEGPSKNQVTYITLGVVGVALVITMVYLWIYFANQSKTADSDRWAELNRIISANAWTASPDELKRFADDKKNAGTPQARLARFELARYWMQSDRDLASLSRDRRDEALRNVKEARNLYVKLIDESGDAPALAQEALMGAANGSETIGEIDQAKKHYEKLAKDYPQSVYGKHAAKQLERITNEKDDLDKLQTLIGSRAP